MPGANLTRIEAEERKSVIDGPIHYTVELDLTRGAKNFGSDTTITFDAKPGANSFLDLIADEVSEIMLNGETLDPAEAFVDSRIELKNLKEHNEVTVKALCQYSNTGEGLHRSVDPSDGNIYLYSQFEVPDARRVYAVFDQPDLKAVFDFSVLAAKSWIVTSNMPVASVDDTETVTEAGTLGDHEAETTKLWKFESTPKMSSYLTAICAGPYAEWHTEYANEDGRTVPMAMYCRQALAKAFAKDVDYLFDITKKGFAFYAKTWGVPYPYAKYDQIYVPEYNAGAMENIGMVTIRDQYVFESKVTDAYAERRVVTVLHELAHMWFGDYVTMKWWNDLWLNESFAEFMSTLATAEATEWKDAWATFSSGEKSWALRQDQLSTTHPIVAPINDLNDTYVNFDGITYAKGASVLKQLVFYVGREKFFKGINSYLNKHAYSNATLADLLAELEDAIFTYREIFSREGIELRYECADDLPPIIADGERMKQVFCNVLDNAAKHGGSGKRIDVSVTAENGSMVIRVRDFGPGIPVEELPYVKQKFYKGSSKARGSGIGLAVCDEIVRLHGGTFDIANAEGGGAVVTISLPMA